MSDEQAEERPAAITKQTTISLGALAVCLGFFAWESRELKDLAATFPNREVFEAQTNAIIVRFDAKTDAIIDRMDRLESGFGDVPEIRAHVLMQGEQIRELRSRLSELEK